MNMCISVFICSGVMSASFYFRTDGADVFLEVLATLSTRLHQLLMMLLLP